MDWSIDKSVGLNGDGSFCPNLAQDQQTIANLLSRIPLPMGGLNASAQVIDIPEPFEDGYCSAELLDAIQLFKYVQSAALDSSLRVEPGSPTLRAMIAIVEAPMPDEATIARTFPLATVILSVVDSVVHHLPPAPASGLPAITFKIDSPELAISPPGAPVRITFGARGSVTAKWGNTFGLSCTANPTMKVLGDALSSGSARNAGAAALESLCDQIRAETRFAASNLFSGIGISVDSSGNFSVGGSVGNGWVQTSAGFQPPRTLTATGSLTINSDQLVPSGSGGKVKFYGTLAGTIKCTVDDESVTDSVSLLEFLAEALPAGIVVLDSVAGFLTASRTVEAAAAALEEFRGLLEEFFCGESALAH